MKIALRILYLFLVLMVLGSCSRPAQTDIELQQQAKKLAQEIIIIDTHLDVPYRLHKKMEDISARTEKGNFDYPRAKEGGLNVPFMAIYIPSERESAGTAYSLADSLIDMVEGVADKWPDKFVMATSVHDVREQFGSGKISIALGMENGAPIAGNLENISHFYDRGIRYITLTHGKDNHICDSSYDTTYTWNGLSHFGRKVVPEMNRLGIMIDVSHITDSSFYQVLRLSKAPVIDSHSSCRYFTPGWERNISDDMIRVLAEQGGVIQINFGSSFVNNAYRMVYEELWRYLDEHHMKYGQKETMDYIANYKKEHPMDYADVSEVVDHIEHVIHLVGIDYVGLGSDFDGLGDSLPNGLKDVSDYPNIIYHLLKRGYSEQEIRKVCGENLLRVWSEVEQTAEMMGSNSVK